MINFVGVQRWLILIGDLYVGCDGMARRCWYTGNCFVSIGDRFNIVHFWYEVLIVRFQYGTFAL